jgi:3-dehydrosphinganine reductase
MKSQLGKIVLITGGSSGIGLETARLFVKNGAHVSILARRSDQLENARQSLLASCQSSEQKISTYSVDVADQSAVNSFSQKFVGEMGTPDYLINSAGIAHPGNVEDLDLDIFHKTMDVNFFGLVNVVKAFLPGMLSRKSGHIVNISSLAGVIGVYGYTAYSSSKFAVTGFTDVLRAEMKPRGIRVSLVLPSDTKTPQLDYENQFIPPITRELNNTGGLLSAEQVASSIIKGIEQNKYIITTGFDGSLMFWASRLTGNLIYPLMDWMIQQASRKVNRNTGS